jgi:hypothetical protein
MALGPINYQMQVATPFESVLQGMTAGAQMANIEAARMQREAQAAAQQQAVQQQQALDQAYAALRANPNPQFDDYERVALMLPKDRADVVFKAFESRSKKEQQETLNFSGNLLAVAKTGNRDMVVSMLNEHAQGLRNAGRAAEAKTWEDSARLAELAGPEDVDRIVGISVAKLPGGKDLIENVNKVEQQRREAKLFGPGLREATARADRAVADAITAQATATNAGERAAADAALAKAQAAKAKVEADFAEKNAIADLQKKAADVGLTKAQTNSAIAQTRKLGVEISKAAIELEGLKASGGVDPAKKFDQEEKIRREWQARSKVYSELGSTFSNIQASAGAKTGPGDIALITGFMKMLDPGSVVRETEFATARDTAGLFDRLANQAQKLQSGQIFSLDSKQRQEYVTLARQYLDAAQKKADQEKRDLGVVVKNYALNPENVFGIRPAEPSPAAAQPANIPGAAPGQRAPAPAAGQRNVTVDF